MTLHSQSIKQKGQDGGLGFQQWIAIKNRVRQGSENNVSEVPLSTSMCLSNPQKNYYYTKVPTFGSSSTPRNGIEYTIASVPQSIGIFLQKHIPRKMPSRSPLRRAPRVYQCILVFCKVVQHSDRGNSTPAQGHKSKISLLKFTQPQSQGTKETLYFCVYYDNILWFTQWEPKRENQSKNCQSLRLIHGIYFTRQSY